VSSITADLERLQATSVFVVGDALLDVYVEGGVERISPEAPVPVFHETGAVRRVLGGAANVAANVAALGAQVVLGARLGADEDAGHLRDALAAARIASGALVVDAALPTTRKTRVLAGYQQLVRLDREVVAPLDADAVAALLSSLAAWLAQPHPGGRALVLADYAKGVLSPELTRRLVAAARDAGVPVLVDPKDPDLSHYVGVTVLKPNRAEARAAAAAAGAAPKAAALADTAGTPTHEPTAPDHEPTAPADTAGTPTNEPTAPDHEPTALADPPAEEPTARADAPIDESAALADAVLRCSGAENVVVSLSAEGVVARGAAIEGTLRVPTRAVQVADVSGAGDTMIAFLAMGAAAGLPLARAVKLANVAAGHVCAKLGTAVLSPSELLAAFGGHVAATAPETWLEGREHAARVTAQLRSDGRRVVFTNGCFDLLHAGHVALLQAARVHGDVLVVGLNSDASVARLKGPTRPVTTLADRAAVLGALAAVDFVCGFDEDTPLELITALQPDVLVKGGDYRPEDVVGGAAAAAWGGRVEIVALLDGRSTTGLLRAGAERADYAG